MKVSSIATRRETLQFLNNRPGCLPGEVRQLDGRMWSWRDDSKKACDFQEPTVGPNYLCCFKTIEELQQKVRASGEQTPWEEGSKS